MERKDGTPITKTTVKVWPPLAAKLKKRMNDACLRRDLYLSRLLVTEVEHLDREVAMANSPAAYDFVFEQLNALRPIAMSVALPPDVVEQVNAVCTRKRIVRDAFFNRLFLLLSVAPKHLDALMFPNYDGDWKRDVWRAYGNETSTVNLGVLPLASVGDPFWALREAFAIERRCLTLHKHTDPDTGNKLELVEVEPGRFSLPDGVYTRYLDSKAGTHDLVGMNCHLPDWRLPEQRARTAKLSLLDELLG